MWSETTLVRDLPFGREFCRLVPKVDLHQHLSGSMPVAKVRRILEEVDPTRAEDAQPMAEPPVRLELAWAHQERYFAAVAIAAAAPGQLERLLEATVATLAEQCVTYSELRIGLKAQPTKRTYLARLDRTLETCRVRFPDVRVRLLLTCARDREVAAAEENIDIAIESFGSGSSVCGVEMGGVATEGNFEDFVPALLKARAAGLPVALHCGEDPARQAEWRRMLAFRPARLGHCVHLDQTNFDTVLAEGLPVEACITCHRLHFGIPFEENIFKRLFPTQQVVLGTDNPALYQTNLSEEYFRCCDVFGLRVVEFIALARRAIDFTFQDESAKAELRHRFDVRVSELRRHFSITTAVRGEASTEVGARL